VLKVGSPKLVIDAAAKRYDVMALRHAVRNVPTLDLSAKRQISLVVEPFRAGIQSRWKNECGLWRQKSKN